MTPQISLQLFNSDLTSAKRLHYFMTNAFRHECIRTQAAFLIFFVILIITFKSNDVSGKGGEGKIWLDPIEITNIYNFGYMERRQILIITQKNVNLFINEWRKWHGTN